MSSDRERASKMEVLREYYANYPTQITVASGVVAAAVGVVLYKWLTGRNQDTDTEGHYPRDTVILHQVGRGPFAPSMTPFAVKLETYLRMAKIPYLNVHGYKQSSKRKWPWISYNGQSIADSAFCIDFLNKERHVDLNSWLSPEQRAVALAFQRLAEEDLYWVLLVQRWVQRFDSKLISMAFPMPMAALFFRLFTVPTVRKGTWAQGIGRHSESQVLQIARKDLDALSNYLGSKKFLMGDQPCEEDCAIFGQLSQIYWQLVGPTNVMFKEEFPKLVEYCERMKDKFWPDWVECTTQGATIPATK